jgi:RNA polymerase sigma-70 factor (ECF subfamily)
VRPERAGEREAGVGGIVAELQAGLRREENFRRLFELYYSRVFHFFAKRRFSPEDCFDLTQETFLGVFRGVGSFRGEAEFEAWVFRIASNLYRKRLRWGAAEKRAGTGVALESLGDGDGAILGDGPGAIAAAAEAPERRILDAERSRRLRAAVQTLPDQMRKCLVLRAYHDLKYREIASVMRISIETVKAHLFQARLRIKEALGDAFQDLDL